MSLAASLTAAETAAGVAASSMLDLGEAMKKVGDAAETTDTWVSRMMKTMGNTSSLVRHEASLVKIQQTSGRTTDQIRKLDKALVDVSKSTRLSRQALLNLTAEMQNNLALVTLSEKQFARFAQTLGTKFPQSAERVAAVLGQVAEQHVAVQQALKTGNADFAVAISRSAAMTEALEGNYKGAQQLLQALTPASDELREVSLAQQEASKELENAQLRWAEQTKYISEAAVAIDKFLAKNYEFLKTLGSIGIAVGGLAALPKILGTAKGAVVSLIDSWKQLLGMAKSTGGALGGGSGAPGGGGGGLGGMLGGAVAGGGGGGLFGGGGGSRRPIRHLGARSRFALPRADRMKTARGAIAEIGRTRNVRRYGRMSTGRIGRAMRRSKKGRGILAKMGGMAQSFFGGGAGGGGVSGGGTPVFVTNWPAAMGGSAVGGVGDAIADAIDPGDAKKATRRAAKKRIARARMGGRRIGGYRSAAGRVASRLGRSGSRGAGMLGKAGGFLAKGLGKIAGPLALLMGASDAVSGYQQGGVGGAVTQTLTGSTKKQGMGWSMGSGAMLGAGIGTMIAPGVGTAIGAGIGGLAGGIAEYFKGGGSGQTKEKEKQKKKEEEIAKEKEKQLELEKRNEQAATRRALAQIQIAQETMKEIELKEKLNQLEMEYLKSTERRMQATGASAGVLIENMNKQLEVQEKAVKLEEERLAAFDKLAEASKGMSEKEKKEKISKAEQKVEKAKKSGTDEEIKAAELELKMTKAALNNDEKRKQAARESAQLRLKSAKDELKAQKVLNAEREYELKQRDRGVELAIMAADVRTMKAAKMDPVSIAKVEVAKAKEYAAEREDAVELEKKLRAEMEEVVAAAGSAAEKDKVRKEYAHKIRQAQQKQAEATAKMAEQADYIRRDWMEVYQAQMIGASSGTYMMPSGSELSGLQEKGAAFRPFGHTRAGGGAGTYQQIYGRFDPFLETGRKQVEGRVAAGTTGTKHAKDVVSSSMDEFTNVVVQAIKASQNKLSKEVNNAVMGRQGG